MSEQVKQEGDFKIKAKVLKPKQLTKSDKPIKIDLSKPKTEADAIPVGETKKVVVGEQTGDSPKVDERVPEPNPVSEIKEEEVKPIEEIVEEQIEEIGEKIEQKLITPTQEEIREVAQLPENIEKVINFMKETGGTLDDYVRLNADYSNVDNDALLKEYYRNTKSHLDSSEINFMIEDNFSYDEEVDEERDVRKAKLAYKEEVAKAKQHLEGLKSKYYKEVKSRPGTTREQNEAVEFFNRYNEEQDTAQQQHDSFKSETKSYFSEEFKGFDFNVGEKKFRYGVKNPSEVADKQSNISNIVKRFLNEDGNVKDVQGYHKAMYAAENADTIAQHFYEQGKTDATRNIAAKSNNISTEARATLPQDQKVTMGGYTVKSISGGDSSNLKVKTRKFN